MMITIEEIATANTIEVATYKSVLLQRQRQFGVWEHTEREQYDAYSSGYYKNVNVPILDINGVDTGQTTTKRVLRTSNVHPDTFEVWQQSRTPYVKPINVTLGSDIQAILLSAIESDFDRKLSSNMVEVRPAVIGGDGKVVTPALRLKARVSDAGLIQEAIHLMVATNVTTYNGWNSPKWYILTISELTKLLKDGIASIAALFEEFRQNTIKLGEPHE